MSAHRNPFAGLAGDYAWIAARISLEALRLTWNDPATIRAVLATLAHDETFKLPLNGTRAHWRAPTGETDAAGAWEPEGCRWRRYRDSHCMCWRCGSQGIENGLARAIVAPCRPPEFPGCYWCRYAGCEDHYAPGIVRDALKLVALERAALSRLTQRLPCDSSGVGLKP